ncbi:TonB-dependent receptor domain-containing protein [Methylomicrobium lacus]|uniref:TonB-dependent receptor domain-containing protein n=1 Tax=Methylomicrobium lacus TaxID=136992 RepID=UPI0035A8D03C
MLIKQLLSLFFLLAQPCAADAHAPGPDLSGWHHGFSHPLHGSDHLLTMIAVGMWAAQQRGRAVWLLPLAFVGVMSLGGLAGVAGAAAPAAETMILLSVPVFGVLVIRRLRFRILTSLTIVGFFAFFHGFAHGQEMPASASLLSFALGFMLATLLLHGVGIVAARLFLLAFACLFGGAHADPLQTDAAASAEASSEQEEDVRLPEVEVIERSDSQVGIAGSASEGNIGQAQLKLRPIFRPGEVLETVPGLIVSQHSGEGKANQYFLRGFNLDHGTDFLTQIDGVPVNMVSHAHGQGWTDTGFLIPELIRTLGYQKGVYYAENGDFSSAGAANIHYFDTLPAGILKFTGGSFDYYRGLVADSVKIGSGNLLYAVEGNYNDGPWQNGNHFKKGNVVLRYSREHGDSGWSATAMAYGADWNSTDQIPRRTVDAGRLDRFGLIDPTDGGRSRRYSLTTEWHRQSDHNATRVMAYGVYSLLDLYSNFTYFLDDPVRGDQFAQPDRRWQSGLKAAHTLYHQIGGMEAETTLGLQFRNDLIDNGLLLTEKRRCYGAVREDHVVQSSLSPYAENKTQWNAWLRSNVGVRFDGFRFDVNSDRQENSGNRLDGLVSPKGGIVLGPWEKSEIYLNGGLGFHSNDARGINTRIDPKSGDAVKRADPLVRTYGAEIGARTARLDGLQSTVSLWWLDIDSELVFVGDAGTTEAGRPSRRYGVEFANYYTPTDWLTFDADFSFSKARFRNNEINAGSGLPVGKHIPGSVETVIAAGATVHDLRGFFGGLRLRYFGPRALIENNSERSKETVLLSANLGYQINKHLTLQAEVFNLLNRKDSAIDYFYTSRLPGEPGAGVDDSHFHPVEPIGFRLGFTANF